MSSADVKMCAALMWQIEEFSSRYVECMATAELTGTQALMLMRLGDGEERIGNLGNIYFGTNISYNVKKLSDLKYIQRKGSSNDRRVGMVSLTERGKKIRADLEQRHQAFALDDANAMALANSIRGLRDKLNGNGYPTRIVR